MPIWKWFVALRCLFSPVRESLCRRGNAETAAHAIQNYFKQNINKNYTFMNHGMMFFCAPANGCVRVFLVVVVVFFLLIHASFKRERVVSLILLLRLYGLWLACSASAQFAVGEWMLCNRIGGAPIFHTQTILSFHPCNSIGKSSGKRTWANHSTLFGSFALPYSPNWHKLPTRCENFLSSATRLSQPKWLICTGPFP